MTQDLTIRRLRAGTLLRIYMTGLLFVFTPFTILCGIAALFGADTIVINGSHVHGSFALVASILLGPIFSIVFSLGFLVVTWPGLWIYSRFRTITISFHADDNSRKVSQDQ